MKKTLTAIAAAAAVSLASAAMVAAEQSQGFIGVVGRWSNVTDGGPAFKIDTAGWSGTTERATLEAISRSLFSTVNDTFITNGTSATALPLAVFPETKNFAEGTIKVQFKLIGGATDKNAGIAFNLRPNGEYLFVRYNILDGNIALWRYRNGARARLSEGESTVALPLATWHELALTIKGNKLSASVNGNALHHEHTLDEPVSGRVGLWTKRDAITVFRNFRVQ